jgi:hypothetical protein
VCIHIQTLPTFRFLSGCLTTARWSSQEKNPIHYRELNTSSLFRNLRLHWPITAFQFNSDIFCAYGSRNTEVLEKKQIIPPLFTCKVGVHELSMNNESKNFEQGGYVPPSHQSWYTYLSRPWRISNRQPNLPNLQEYRITGKILSMRYSPTQITLTSNVTIYIHDEYSANRNATLENTYVLVETVTLTDFCLLRFASSLITLCKCRADWPHTSSSIQVCKNITYTATNSQSQRSQHRNYISNLLNVLVRHFLFLISPPFR